MAYSNKITRECPKSGCRSTADYEVFNDRNSSHGKYCGKHSAELVRTLNRTEKEFYEMQKSEER